MPTFNHECVKVATALDPCSELPKEEQGDVQTSLEAFLQVEAKRATPTPTEEPLKKKHVPLFSQTLVLKTNWVPAVP